MTAPTDPAPGAAAPAAAPASGLASLEDAARVLTGRLQQRLLFVWRHTAHVVIGALVAWEISKAGFGVSDDTKGLAETLLFGFGTAAYGYVQHWLETRQGSAWWARAARSAGRWLVLGAPAVVSYSPAPAA